MTDARLAASYVQLLYEYLAGLGHDPLALLGPLPAAHFVPLPIWQAQLARAAQLDPRPALGLRIAEGISARHFGVVGYAALACDTLLDALQRLERYHASVYDVNPARVSLREEGLCIEWGVERGQPGALVDETALACLMRLTRDMTGRPLQARELGFVNPRPTDLRPYEDFFGCPVHFKQTSTRLVLATQDLALPMRKSDPALLALLDRQAERLLQELGVAMPAALAAYRMSLVALIREGETSLSALAGALQMSPRSLQRRLAEQGLSFQTLLDQTRQHLADAYLRDPRLELAEIALLLGYSEQSAFTRAFRQWTGLAPAQWRKQQHPLKRPFAP